MKYGDVGPPRGEVVLGHRVGSAGIADHEAGVGGGERRLEQRRIVGSELIGRQIEVATHKGDRHGSATMPDHVRPVRRAGSPPRDGSGGLGGSVARSRIQPIAKVPG